MCNEMGRKAIFLLIFIACFGYESAKSETLICTQPLFAKEMEYRGIIFGGQDPDKAIAAAKELNEMLQTYCRKIGVEPTAITHQDVGDNCDQESGTYQGKKVYWGECHE